MERGIVGSKRGGIKMSVLLARIEPKIDFSWVPESLQQFTSGSLATAILFLVLVFVCGVVLWVGGKLVNSHRRSALSIVLGAVLAAALITALSSGIDWTNNNINPLPNGITTSAQYSSLLLWGGD